MKSYSGFLEEIDGWFARVRERHADDMACGRGCALCCYGLFDISLPDALLVAKGLSRLHPEVLQSVREKAAQIQSGIVQAAPELQPPYILCGVADARIDVIVEAARSPCCPLLGPRNECLIYECRPLACRLEGVPMVDTHEGLFGDWCSLNFRQGVVENALVDLRLDYGGIQEVERTLTEQASEDWFHVSRDDLTVFIPSVIVEFEGFWKKQLDRENP